VFENFRDFDFILLMATVPGQSGGKFDAQNFGKIREFRKQFPDKAVHVDGGVNGEVSFILRNMGVESSVSGSFLFNAPSVGHALMDLTKRAVTSQFMVRDFMVPLNESPKLRSTEYSVMNVLSEIEKGKLGFVLILGENNVLEGLVSNADVRKALIKNEADLTGLALNNLLNSNPISCKDTATVNELLEMIRTYSFPISYLPVVDENNRAVGIVTFVNLIKGEI
jgi:predicted transcriptional regulator